MQYIKIYFTSAHILKCFSDFFRHFIVEIQIEVVTETLSKVNIFILNSGLPMRKCELRHNPQFLIMWHSPWWELEVSETNKSADRSALVLKISLNKIVNRNERTRNSTKRFHSFYWDYWLIKQKLFVWK